MQTTETIRAQAENLLSEIKSLPEPERLALLRELRAKFSGNITSATRSSTAQATMQALNATRAAEGVSDVTREKLRAKAQASWARRKAGQAGGSVQGPD